MSRVTNYLAIMILFYAIYYGGKLMFDVIVGNAEKPVETVFYSLACFAFAFVYYIFVYRPYKGK